MKNCLHQIGLRACVGNIFLIALGSTIPGKAGPGCIRQMNGPGEQDGERHSLLRGLCFKLLHRTTAQASLSDRLQAVSKLLPFCSKFLLVGVFHHDHIEAN